MCTNGASLSLGLAAACFDRAGRLDASEAPVEVVETWFDGLTDTDQEFELTRPGYWIYGKEIKKRECWKCGEEYETRLEMNKFCNPRCKEEWLSESFGSLKKLHVK